MKSFFKYLLVLLSGYFLLIISIVIVITILSDTEPIIDDNSYLHLSIGGSLPEYTAPTHFEELTGGGPMDLKKIRENLEKAAVDDRINGVLLDLGFLRCGFSKIEELLALIDTYKKSGKKIYAFTEFGMTKEYLVATACDSVFMPANSTLFLNGLGAELTFYKGLFEKIGVRADFIHIGAYKNAPDQYTRTDMSDEQREVLNQILDQFYEYVIETIASRRGISPVKIKNLINTVSGFSGNDALEYGLIDGTLYKDDIIKKLYSNGLKATRVSGETYARIPISSLGIRKDSRIAVVHISGTISSGNDVDDPILGKLAGENTIVENIKAAADSRSIKAIILRIDSPGGSSISSDIIWKAVKDAREKKPVIASISDLGASGGYYVAAGADTIISSENSLVGSIGIFAGKFIFSGLYNKLGLTTQRLSRGENAGFFSTNSLWSPSEREVMTRLLTDFYKNFVNIVAENRNKDFDEIEKLAQGRVWSGTQGYQNGLIDTSGTFYDAVEMAKKMAHIDKDESVRLSYYPQEKDLFSELYGLISIKTNYLRMLQQNENTLLTNFQNQPMALMPFILEWK